MSISQNYPTIAPSLSLDFANVKALDPRVTFARASTGTYYDANGVLQTEPSGVARFDHDPITGESLGLLVEEQRTNLVTYSEDFSDASWIKADATITTNTTVAPDGTLTGDKIVENVNTGKLNSLGRSIANTAPETRTYSFFVKAAERRYFKVLYSGGQISGNPMVIFDLQDGVVTQNTATLVGSIVSVGNGWHRASVTSATGTLLYFGPYPNATGAFPGLYNGDGYSGIYIWGAQLEENSYKTSYIKTVASQVTRAADSASMVGANFSEWFNNSQGALFVDGFFREDGRGASYTNIAMITDSPTGNTGVGYNVSSTGRVYFRTGSSGVIGLPTISTEGANLSLAGAYNTNDFAVSLNGATALTSSGNYIQPLNRLNFGNAGSGPCTGYFKKLSYYSQRLTNEQLVALTS